VSATILGPNLEPTPFSQAVPNPRTRINISPRVDFQLTPSNTLTVRYQYFRNSEDNEGVGQFSLLSQAYDSLSSEQTLQISDTQILSTNVVNETRFQYIHNHNDQTVQDFSPTISVLGAFTGGGNQLGNLGDKQNHYELQNYTSIAHGNHLIKFGGRLRAVTDSNESMGGFNGVFTFSSLAAYQTDPRGGTACVAPLAAMLPGPPKPSQLAACGASQLSITTGQPLSEVTLVDAGLYGQDDWRIRPNLTLSYGLRFETQNAIHDHGDFAPRISFAWGLGGAKKTAAKTVLRGGFGIFYDRIPYGLVLQTERLNGFTQQQTIVQAGNGPNGQTSPTRYQDTSNLRAPATFQTAASVERQLAKSSTVAVTYVNSYGQHQLFIRNANAPLPGTFPPGIRPFGGTDNLYQYDSEGIFRQNQLIVNVRSNFGTKLSLSGFYTLNYSNSDLGSGAGGSANFITNQYDPAADYGRSAFDVRHRGVVIGTISLPYAFRLNPFVIASSGQPYNVTVGQDLNGDSIFNDRPSMVSNARCPNMPPFTSGIACTSLGTFNLAPVPGQALIPVNLGTATALFTMNLRLSKTFGLGREMSSSAGQGPGGGPDGGGRGGGRGGPGGGLGGRGLSGGGGGPGGAFGGGASTNRRYNVTFSVSARNIFNRVNLAPPIGNLDSPLFGQSNDLAGGPYSFGSATRRIDLQALFSF
jgi:hypothetical protein